MRTIIKKENSELNKKIDIQKNNNTSLGNNNCDFKAKFDKLNTKVTQFNKGQNDLNMILSSSRPLYDKSGLGYNKTDRRNNTRCAFMYSKYVSACTRLRVKFKSNYLQKFKYCYDK